MATRRRTQFPGLSPLAQRELVALQDDLLDDLKALRREVVGSTTATKTRSYNAQLSEVVRVLPPSGGLQLTFPGANTANQNRWIEVIHLGGGTATIIPVSGLVEGAASAAITVAGRYHFKSDGASSWWAAKGI